MADELPVPEDEIRAELARQCKAMGGQAAWGARYGFSQSYVSELVTGSAEMSEPVANILGFISRRRWFRFKVKING